MNKIWLITKREYLTRVRNKTFLLTTFLLPLVIVLFIAGSVMLAVKGQSRHRIAVIDANSLSIRFTADGMSRSSPRGGLSRARRQ